MASVETTPPQRSAAYLALRSQEAGTDAPVVTPADAFRGAVRAFIQGPRLDMGRLAGELGISKATLYRWTGSRERLLAEVLTYLSQTTWAEAHSQTERLKGADRVLAAVRVYLEALMTFEPFRRFIQTETPLAFRLLTTRGGLPQGDFVELLAGLLTYEHEEHGMPLRADAETLAYAIVRVSEGFIYTDPVAEIEPDIDAAMEIASLW